jgi:PIN domain nuclease of toxin-antitoxin system
MLDTHYLLWIIESPGNLRPHERELIDREDTELFASAASIWELRVKWHKFHISGDRKLEVNPGAVLSVLRDIGVTVLPLTGDDAAAEADPPVAHRDPFDKVILIHAQQQDLKLLTRDSELLQHPVALQF